MDLHDQKNVEQLTPARHAETMLEKFVVDESIAEARRTAQKISSLIRQRLFAKLIVREYDLYYKRYCGEEDPTVLSWVDELVEQMMVGDLSEGSLDGLVESLIRRKYPGSHI